MTSLRLPGYEIEAEVGRGARTVVYRASRGGRPVVVKTCLDDDRRELHEQFRREAAYLACLRHAALPTVLEVGLASVDDGGPPVPCLVLERVEGRTLSEVISTGPLGEANVAAIGQTLASALAELDALGLVHRDVKPDNIIIASGGEARLIDFGFATRAVDGDGHIAGTFTYSAPEQTGMLRRPVDGRSDLYSLGVVLFECATGTRPFDAADVGEVIRQHTVLRPPSVRDLMPSASLALEAVIDKLLAKDPDDRYQNGLELRADLERLGTLNEALGAGRPVRLGRPRIPLPAPPMVGREKEMERAALGWARAAEGHGGVLVVEGLSGSGKSRLMADLIRRARSRGGLVVTGRCHEGDAPLSALRGALDACCGRLLGEAGPQPDSLSRTIALTSPVLAGLLRESAEEELESDDVFCEAVAGVLVESARRAGPMLLWIDDLQGADEATRRVLQRLAARLDDVPLLLGLTSRDGVDEAWQIAARTWRVHLGALDFEAMRRLVSHHLGERPVPGPLVEELLQASDGNPLAAIELLRSLLDEGVLQPGWHGWTLTAEGLERLRYPQGVVALVVERLRDLDADTSAVLRAASVIGPRFTQRMLVDLCGHAEPHQAIEGGLRARLLERVTGDVYAFSHDKIHEAVRVSVEEDEARRLHQRAAERMEAAGAATDERVFEMARHFLRGEAACDGAAETARRRAFDACFAAARHAVATHADGDAHAFLHQAASIWPAASADGAFEELFGDVCKRMGRMSRSLPHFAAALRSAATPLARASLHVRMAQVHLVLCDTESAASHLQQGFTELGERPPRGTLSQLVSALAAQVRGSEREKDEGERRRLQMLGLLYHASGHLAYLANTPGSLMQVVLRLLDIGRRLGPSNASVRADCGYAATLATLGRSRAAARVAQRAVDTARGLGDVRVVAHALVLQALSTHMAGDARAAEEMGRACLQEHGRWMEAGDHEILGADLTYNLMTRGYLARASRCLAAARGEALRGGLTGTHDLQLTVFAAALHASAGQKAEAQAALTRAEGLLEAVPASPVRRCVYLQYALWTALEMGDSEPLVDRLLDEHLLHRFPVLLTPHHLRLHYVLAGYARLGQARGALAAGDHDAVRRRLGELSQALRDLRQAGRSPLYRVHAAVLDAGRQALSGRPAAALRRLAEVDAQAAHLDCPWAAMEAAELRAFILSGAGEAPKWHARAALQLAAEHGWAQRARRLRQAWSLESAGRPPSSGEQSVPGTASRSIKGQRYLDALLQVSLAAASTLDAEQQARAVLDEIVHILGAERAFLFLVNDEGALSLRAGRDGHHNDIAELSAYSSTVVDRVRSDRTPLIVSGTEEGAVLGSQSAVVHDLRSIMCAPVMMRDHLVGVVYLDSRVARGVFSPDDVHILGAMTSHIGIALETARAAQLEIHLEAERQQLELAEKLRALNTSLTDTLELGEVLFRLMESLQASVGFDAARAFLTDDDASFRCVQMVPVGAEDMQASAVLSAWLADVHAGGAPRTCQGEDVGDPQGEDSLMGLPVVARDRTAAVLILRRHGEGFEERDAELAMTFCGQGGFAIENSRLFAEVRRLATTDELTGVSNRRHLFSLADRDYKIAMRTGGRMCALMLDVDHFKRVNDTYGHASGDVVLRVMSARCRDQLRGTDIFGRYGGEEFVVVLSDGVEAGLALSNRLLQAVRATPIAVEDAELTITMSIGLAEADPSQGTLAELLQNADAALYRAKEAGRNRVAVYEREDTSPSPTR